jgi:DNA primase
LLSVSSGEDAFVLGQSVEGFLQVLRLRKGGNAFTFLMEMEGLNFPEAVQRVAEISGVPLPEPIDDGQYEQSKKRKREENQTALGTGHRA